MDQEDDFDGFYHQDPYQQQQQKPQPQPQQQQRHDQMSRQDQSGRPEEWIMLNVGGKIFSTTRTTLCTNEPNSMLARMFSYQNCSSAYNQDTSTASTTSVSAKQTSNNNNNDTNEVDEMKSTYQQLVNNSRYAATSTIMPSIGLRPSPKDANGAYLIDRSPEYFEPILNYLRHGKLIMNHNVNVQGVLEEAKFYGIVSLLPMLELETERLFKKRHQDMLKTQMFDYQSQEFNQIRSQDATSAGADGTQLQTMPSLTRQDVIRAIIPTSASTKELRFQGCNLAGANLSKLDLRHINFKYANLRNANLKGANLSCSNLERADLYQCNLEGAQLIGTNLNQANLENSNLRAVTTLTDNLTIPKTSFEAANLKNTNFEGSQLAEVNLRKASLRGSNLQNCDLSRAILASTDLENCDLSGSNLNEANLRGANIKGAQFEREVL